MAGKENVMVGLCKENKPKVKRAKKAPPPLIKGQTKMTAFFRI